MCDKTKTKPKRKIHRESRACHQTCPYPDELLAHFHWHTPWKICEKKLSPIKKPINTVNAKIDQYFAKIQTKVWWHVFLDSRCIFGLAVSLSFQ